MKQSATGVDTSGRSRPTSLKLGYGAMTAQWANLWLSSMATPSASLGRVTLISKLLLNQSTMGSQCYLVSGTVGIKIVATLSTSKSHRLQLH